MITLRLFKAADPFQELTSRTLAHGSITLGRDASAGWVIDDTRGDISRRHCTISVKDDRVHVCDHSTNGVHCGLEKRRAARDVEEHVRAGETLYLGEYMLLVDGGSSQEPPAVEAPAVAIVSTPAPAANTPPVRHAETHAAMLEAFCHGAGVEPSSFIGEDPAAVMTRLGTVYRQVVEDLCLLLGDRADLKDAFKLDRTTISSKDNNPLKWAAPSRVAVDMLKEGDTGFLQGADAFRASFEDLRRHNAAVSASSMAVVDFILKELSPEALEASSQRPQALSFLPRGDLLWRAYQARHAALSNADQRSAAGQIGQVYGAAYQATMKSLEKGEAA